MQMAEIASTRSACKRCAVGAIITDIELRNAISMGYNGPPRGAKNECPGDPAIPGACGCIHAEINALLKAPFDGLALAMFVTTSPCINCARLILNSDVGRVYYRHAYRVTTGIELLREHGVECQQLLSV